MSLLFQGVGYVDGAEDEPSPGSDHLVYRRERKLAEMAEPLGFDSLWSVEHHFTGYTMVPDVFQFLAYMAGQTSHIRLGTMVVVLPWNNPVRVAESVAMLDNLSDGRFKFGIGRGLGRVEFEGLGVPMDESRTRFVESAELILAGLENGYVEYSGKHFDQPRRSIRPAPLRSFKGRTYSAAVSPESLELVARLGVGLLIVPQKPWETTISEVLAHSSIFEEINGFEAPAPVVFNQVFCDKDESRARELGREYIRRYYLSIMKHYELLSEHFAATKGYEYYENAAAQLRKHSTDEALDWYADLQCYGTPAQCVERVAYIREELGCSEFIGAFSFADMPTDDAQRSLTLFVDEVMPRLKEFGLRPTEKPEAPASFPAAF